MVMLLRVHSEHFLLGWRGYWRPCREMEKFLWSNGSGKVGWLLADKKPVEAHHLPGPDVRRNDVELPEHVNRQAGTRLKK